MNSLLKRIALTSLALPLLSGLAIDPAIADGWVRIYTNRTFNYVTYVHKNSIQRQGAIRYFWVHLALTEDGSLAAVQSIPVAGINLYYSADCQSKLVRLRTLEAYDPQGRLLKQENLGDRASLEVMTTDTPETRGLVRYVCDR